MEAIQKKLQNFSRVAHVFVNIGYVASIVGLCLSACALLWAALTGSPSASVQLGGITVNGLMDAANMNLAEVFGMLSFTVTCCAILIAVMRLMMRLFANMRDHYTPFTMENAMLFRRVAVLMIVATLLPAIVGQSVGAACAKFLSLPFEAEYGDAFSLVTVLLFFGMSIVFQYGCALQEQADTTL